MSFFPIQKSISNFEFTVQPFFDIHSGIQNLSSGNSGASNLQQAQPLSKQAMYEHMQDTASCKDEDTNAANGQFLSRDVYQWESCNPLAKEIPPRSFQLYSVPKPIAQTQSQEIATLLELPQELALEISVLLPIKDLLTMQYICKRYKNFIDINPELQIKIAHHYLQTMQPKCNIPIDDLKMDLTNNKLSVEVNNNLCVWKLTQKLNKTMPWISHLIIKDGDPNELTDLFIQLKRQNKRLSNLCLLNCKVDSKTIGTLQDLLSADHNLRPPVLYLSNLKPTDCELPQQLSMTSSHVVIIDPNKADDYSIDRFLTDESDVTALRKLEQQFQNGSLSGGLILEKIKELHPIIQAEIVSSIWHSKLSSPTEAALISKSFIELRVYSFVSEDPYHCAVQVAVKRNLERLQSRLYNP